MMPKLTVRIRFEQCLFDQPLKHLYFCTWDHPLHVGAVRESKLEKPQLSIAI